MIMDGKSLAKSLNDNTKAFIDMIKGSTHGVTPSLAVISVGDDQASEVYIRSKRRACMEVGIEFTEVKLPASATQEELESKIDDLNQNNGIHGIILQLPIPDHLDSYQAINKIKPEKDSDGLTNQNKGALASGNFKVPIPCTPCGIMTLLSKYTQNKLSGKHAVIVGRSQLVGKPLVHLLLNRDMTVTVCHSKTSNLAFHTAQADVLIVAVGKPNLITADMVKPGAIVIDVGINRVDGKLCGDVDFENVKDVASAITPVPGGVGPMTVAMLMLNTAEQAFLLGVEPNRSHTE